jgi:ATP/maltotriose-dependent transcriptional regulator MalT
MTSLPNELDRGRDALARGAWPEAYEALRACDAAALTGADLEGLADAAWWVSRRDESIAARQRAYAAYAAASEDLPAASMAVRLCVEHFIRGEPAVAGGWLMRAQRHLREQPESAEHGFLAAVEANVARLSGDPDRGVELARRGTEIAQRAGHRDLVAVAIHIEGLSHVAAGRVAEGVALLDEAMTSVVAGELSPFFTGVVYCDVIEACLQLGDVGRAGEWTEAARLWCEGLAPESPFPGLCRINRAELAILRGAWSDAEAEAVRASEELLRLDAVSSGAAWYLAGEARRRAGEVAGAEEAFRRAHELGFDPQPGAALLLLSQGRADAASNALRVASGSEHGNPFRRAALLGAHVEAALAAGALDEARAAASDLDAISRRFSAASLSAAADAARGAVLLAEGDAAAALGPLRAACDAWQRLRLPYDAARVRVLLGRALLAAGEGDAGRAELGAAAAAFERMGAVPDARTARALAEPAERLPRGLTAREAEVLRLVAAGRSNREIAAALVISEHTVARHVQNVFAKLDVSSRAAATAFAVEQGIA